MAGERVAKIQLSLFPQSATAANVRSRAHGYRARNGDGGPERKRYSDPDASWGHRSAISTRKGGGFYGYKIHAAVCTVTGLPLAWRVETARHHESQFAIDLLDATKARGFAPKTAVLDKGYDTNAIYAECAKRDCVPVIPLKKGRHDPGSPISRGSDEWRKLYRSRGAVEREFGRLKHFYSLVLRTRGLKRAQLHADLVMLARLSQALSRAPAVPLAA